MNKKNWGLFKDPRWKAKRLIILERDGNKCTECGGTENLQVHHAVFEPYCDPWESADEDLITICKDCFPEWNEVNGNVKRDHSIVFKEAKTDSNLTYRQEITSNKRLTDYLMEDFLVKKKNINLIFHTTNLLISDILKLSDIQRSGNIKIISKISDKINASINIYINYK